MLARTKWDLPCLRLKPSGFKTSFLLLAVPLTEKAKKVFELIPPNRFRFPLLGVKREGTSTSPPSLQLDFGQLDGALKEILAYEEGAVWNNGDLKPH